MLAIADVMAAHGGFREEETGRCLACWLLPRFCRAHKYSTNLSGGKVPAFPGRDVKVVAVEVLDVEVCVGVQVDWKICCKRLLRDFS